MTDTSMQNPHNVLDPRGDVQKMPAYAAERAQPPGGTDVVQVCVAIDVQVVRLAERQRGVVARRQLIGLGMTRGTIDRWIKQGRLHRIHQGVYFVGHAVPAPLALEQAALLATGDEAVLSHYTAALLQGFLEEEYGGPIHVTTPRHRGRPRDVVVHTSKRLGRAEWTWRHDLPVTTPARTLIDLAEVAEARVVERAVETAFAKRRVTEAQLRKAIARLPGRKGGFRLAAFLDHRGGAGFTRSVPEDRLRALLKDTDLPPATFNTIVEGKEVDVYFADPKVAVEVDSLLHHDGQRAFTRDRRKWAFLESKGVRVIGVTAWELEHEPHVAVARIATAVALASAR